MQNSSDHRRAGTLAEFQKPCASLSLKRKRVSTSGNKLPPAHATVGFPSRIKHNSGCRCACQSTTSPGTRVRHDTSRGLKAEDKSIIDYRVRYIYNMFICAK